MIVFLVLMAPIVSQVKTQLFVPVDTIALKEQSTGHSTPAQEVSTSTRKVQRSWVNANHADWAIIASKAPLNPFNALQGIITLTIILLINV
jgi:hypothetical protein